MTTTINGAYLDGIKEGRVFLKNFPEQSNNRDDIKKHIANAKENIERHSGAMRDCFRGNRDFWQNQLKKYN